MPKPLAESLIRLAGLYFIVSSMIALGGVVVMYFQSHLSDRMTGMGIGDAFWMLAGASVSLLAGAIVLMRSERLAEMVARAA